MRKPKMGPSSRCGGLLIFAPIKLIVNIVLLGLVLFQSTGLLLVHNLQLAEVRYEMKQRLKSGVPEEDLVLLKIPKELEKEPNSEFIRFHEREFRYRGEMYDVIRQEEHHDETWYTCIHDVKESGLFKKLDELSGLYLNTDQQQKHKHGFILNFFDQDYSLESWSFTIPKDGKAALVPVSKNSYLKVFPDRLLRPPHSRS